MVLCKVKLVGTWIKRREMVVGARRIIREKLKGDEYKDEQTWSLEGRRVGREGDDNVDHM